MVFDKNREKIMSVYLKYSDSAQQSIEKMSQRCIAFTEDCAKAYDLFDQQQFSVKAVACVVSAVVLGLLGIVVAATSGFGTGVLVASLAFIPLGAKLINATHQVVCEKALQNHQRDMNDIFSNMSKYLEERYKEKATYILKNCNQRTDQEKALREQVLVSIDAWDSKKVNNGDKDTLEQHAKLRSQVPVILKREMPSRVDASVWRSFIQSCKKFQYGSKADYAPVAYVNCFQSSADYKWYAMEHQV